ncbi:MAG: tRNA dihydrouridine synthase DusB [Eubacteriales bacterium]
MSYEILLAPMAGVTDHAFRVLCHRMGCDRTVSEMISAKAIHYKDEKTATLARIRADEGPVVLQIFGAEPEIMAEAADLLTRSAYHGCKSEAAPVGIDINMGCPMKKITGNGEGSALMRDPALIERIVGTVKSATPLPVSVKLRTGWDDTSVNAVECALAAVAGGADLIAIHGRTRQQLYRPPVSRTVIADVKRAVNVPVIANGGIDSPESAAQMLTETGADGIMIGQAAEGNPWLFAELAAARDGRPYTPPTPEERMTLAIEHLRLLVEDKDEYIGIREARRHLGHHCKGMPGATAYRDAVCQAETAAELLRLTEEFIRGL